MDQVTLRYFNDELRHLRDVAWEFAEQHERVGNRLALGRDDCGDPYVERLLEGFAFLAARIQRKLDDEFPTFTSHLLEMIYPDYLAPTPAMVVAAFQPDQRAGSLVDGYAIERDSRLTSRLGASEETRCTFLTKHAVTLWPIELADVAYLTGGSLSRLGPAASRDVKAALRLTLRTQGDVPFEQLSLDELPLFLTGSEGLAGELYESIIGHGAGLVVQPSGDDPDWRHAVGRSAISTYGFDDDQALLPCSLRSFHGHRLLKEFFSFEERFLFVRLSELAPAIRRCSGSSLDVVILLDRTNAELEGTLSKDQIALFATPALNLFERPAEPILVEPYSHDFHVVTDRVNSLDFEVHSVTGVRGIGEGSEQVFLPFFHTRDRDGEDGGFYTVERRPRTLSSSQKRRGGARSSYLGSELYIRLVDASGSESWSNLQRLTVDVMCTNRDLPLHMPLDVHQSHFTMDTGAPVERISCLAGPTRPKEPLASGKTSWSLINHLALNYRSIVDDGDGGGADALRALLSLYRPNQTNGSELDGVARVSSKPITRRLPFSGPITFGRGLEIEVALEAERLRPANAFLLGAVLDRFFAKYMTINSFTETVITNPESVEIMRWPIRLGRESLV
ncbi:MAG: type VI secretion system baseplate subunit TssF [Geminicoccaceae bacterium]